MKRSMLLFITVLIAALPMVGLVNADVVAKYEFTGWYKGLTQTNEHVIGTDYAFTSDSSSKVTGLSGLGNPGVAFLVQAMADSTESYTSFSITLDSGYSLTMDNITFDSNRGVDAPTFIDVMYSTNGTSFSSIGSGSISGTSYQTITANNGGSQISGLSGTVFFRIHGDAWGGKVGPPPVDNSQIMVSR